MAPAENTRADALDGTEPGAAAHGASRFQPPSIRASSAGALQRASEYLLTLQSEAGWWKGALESNATMNAEDILLRHFLGIGRPEINEPTAAWIRSQQQADGTWNTFYQGPPDLSTTVEAYVALRLSGDDVNASSMRRAAAWIRANGGIAKTRVFTRIWLALFGWFPWDQLPEIPPEIILLPDWCPLNIYDLGSWARGTVVALSLVSAQRPVRSTSIELTELHPDPDNPYPSVPTARRTTWERAFRGLDRQLRFYRRWAVRPLRRRATQRAAAWIVERQEADGCWGGIQPPTVYSIIALHLCGYDLGSDVITKGLAALDNYAVRLGDLRMVEACQSPVWDTCLATIALIDAGTERDHPQLVKAADWLLSQESTKRGDWSRRRAASAPASGWAYEFHNETYPDTDDSAVVMLALRRADATDRPARDAAVQRGVEWLWAMQSKSGGWGAFDVDNTNRLPSKVPFCDFGEVTDPPSADVTAHIVELLADIGRASDPRTRRAVKWLLAEQQVDGSWFGRWGCNYIFGTGSVVPALVAAGIPANHGSVVRATSWLLRHQNPDGGWGEDMRSYSDRHWAGRGTSTASQTAWALLALLAAGEQGEPVDRGIAWLVETQRGNGSWDEPQFTGTGFPGDFSLNYHLYRIVWPIIALGRYVQRQPLGAGSGDHAGGFPFPS